MKIICSYCGNPFNDTLEKCPSCGAPNSGVVRRSGSQPITIEELKDWYTAKGLPPYETTRFFIGEDYRKPRAFGIYKDRKSGNFVVYKNKADGSRAVRYSGTDEAYAVNEIYQRLRQEILQQKSAAITKKGGSPKRGPNLGEKKGCLIKLAAILGLPLFFIILGLISLLVQDIPKDGYYLYGKEIYYHYDHIQPDDCSDWFLYSGKDSRWSGPLWKKDVPELLRKDKKACDYYLSEELPASREEPAFKDSICYQDASSSYKSNTGYYRHGENTYYHLDGDIYSGWYYYDTAIGDWYESSYDEIPYELQHSESSEDFYFTPTWDSSTQITDFTDTPIYEDYLDKQETRSYDWDDDDDDDYSWDSSDSGDSWDYGGTDWDSDW